MRHRSSIWLSLLGLFLVLLLSPGAFADAYSDGVSAFQGGDYDGAVTSFKQAVEADPNHGTAYYYLGLSLSKTGDVNEAIRAYEQAASVSRDPKVVMRAKKGIAMLKKWKNTHRISSGSTRKSGSQRKKPARSAKPTKTASASGPGRTQNKNTPDYYNLREVLFRWPNEMMPLKIYIERSRRGIANFDDSFFDLPQQALDKWVSSSDGAIRYVLVSNPKKADLRVTWMNYLVKQDNLNHHSSKRIGVTQYHNMKDGKVDVTISVFDPYSKEPYTKQEISSTLVHEMGHALGISWHSANPSDIMYTSSGGQTELTQGDIMTLRKVYASEEFTNAQNTRYLRYLHSQR